MAARRRKRIVALSDIDGGSWSEAIDIEDATMAWLYLTSDTGTSIGAVQVADESESYWYYVGGGITDLPRGAFGVPGFNEKRVYGIPHFAYSEGTIQHKKMRIGCETASRTWTNVFVELSKVIV